MNPTQTGNRRGAARLYACTAVHGGVEEASPHRLVLMLLDGALGRIAAARGHLEHGEIAARCESISQALAIVGGLRGSLDREAGGELAANLDRLYDYMERRLLQANLEGDAAALDEVHGLLGEVRSGWVAIADVAEHAAAGLAASGSG